MVVTVVLASVLITAAGSSARQPPTGTAMYVAQQDQRLCPSPRCGGYWVTIANGVRTRCSAGVRRARCYVGRAVDRTGTRLIGGIAGGALVRGAIDTWTGAATRLDQLIVWATYAPVGTSPLSGGYYRIVDTGIRCVRAPCFSYRVNTVNASTRTRASSVDLAVSGATAGEVARAHRALRTADGLYTRGRFARSDDGGTVFQALRLYLRAPLPRA